MSADDGLAALRTARDAARARLTEHTASLKAGLTPKALGQRVRRDVESRAQAVAREALEVATDSRGVVIGTLAVLGLWLARKPLLGALRDWRVGRGSTAEEAGEHAAD
ncbi:MAG: hypothetical protein JSS36_05625 [Proteobacteria bacterium]|nr:hypothetical protein [Pseudomonadota bacterium]